jgi:dihydrofolate reductase
VLDQDIDRLQQAELDVDTIEEHRRAALANSAAAASALAAIEHFEKHVRGLNVTLDGCVDHREGIADDETHAFFTRLMDEGGAMLWGRVTYEMMESHWPAVARGDVEAPPAMREWAVQLEAKPKYVVSSTRSDFPWTNSHHLTGDLRTAVQKLKDATPNGVLLGSGKLATELDRLDLIDEYKLLVHPRIAGHGPTLYEGGLPGTRRLELISAKPLRCGAVAVHYRRAS